MLTMAKAYRLGDHIHVNVQILQTITHIQCFMFWCFSFFRFEHKLMGPVCCSKSDWSKKWYLNVTNMQVKGGRIWTCIFFHPKVFQLWYPRILNEDGGNFTLLYNFVLLRPSRKQHGNNDQPCTPIFWNIRVEWNCNTRYYYYVTLKNYDGWSTHVGFSRRWLLHSLTWPWLARIFKTSDGNYIKDSLTRKRASKTPHHFSGTRVKSSTLNPIRGLFLLKPYY
jgi:hypothetical protein